MGKTYASLAEFANAVNNKVLPSTTAIGVNITANQTGTVCIDGMNGIGGISIYGNSYSFNGLLTIRCHRCQSKTNPSDFFMMTLLYSSRKA